VAKGTYRVTFRFPGRTVVVMTEASGVAQIDREIARKMFESKTGTFTFRKKKIPKDNMIYTVEEVK
jgi:hypothetical protein